MAHKRKDPSDLTKRQKVLFDRLVKLGEMASKHLLPVKVASIKGFGSFFRGKPSPKDADIVIQWIEESPRFNAFIKLLQKVRRDVVKRRTESPLNAFLEEFDRANAGTL